MAVIGSIRKHSVILLIIVAGALLAFIIGDLKRPNADGNSNFIKVGKSSISYLAYANKYDHYLELLKQQNNGAALTREDEYQLRDQVYNEFVDSITLYSQMKSLGISVTADELRDLVAGENPNQYARRFFSDANGNYSSQLAQGFLDNMSQYDSNIVKAYIDLERFIERDALQNKYYNMLIKGAYVPRVFAAMSSDEENISADVCMVQIPYSHSSVSDDKITVTDEEIEKWYEENKYRFKQDEEWRALEYVLFPIEPSQEDLNHIEKEVQEQFAEFKESENPKYFVSRMIDSRYDSSYFKQGELRPCIDTMLFNAPIGTYLEPVVDEDYWVFGKLLNRKIRPDSVNVSYIFVSNSGTPEAPRKESLSKRIADSAYNEARMGVDFYAVAEHRSDYPISQQPDSGRYWLTDGGAEQMFFDTLYMLAPGSVVKREYPAGTYIFRINAVTAFSPKIQVAVGRKQIEASSETIDNIESAANNFVNGTTTFEQFEEKANNERLNRRSFDRASINSYNVPGLDVSASREMIRWAYDKKTKKGDISKVFSFDGMYAIAALKDIYPSGYADMSMVRDYAENMVKREKKAEILTNAITSELKEGYDLSKFAAKYEAELDTVNIRMADRNLSHYGPESSVIGKLFGYGKANELKLYKGDMGMYLILAGKFNYPVSMQVNDHQVEQVDAVRNREASQKLSSIQQTLPTALRKMYKISDRRAMFF